MAELIEEQRENLTALSEPETVEVPLKDYEQLDNLPKLNGETIIGSMAVSETVEIASGTTASKYTPIELVTFRNNKRVLTYMGNTIIAESVYGTGENAKFYFTYCEGGSDTTMQTTFWRKYVDTGKAITTVARTNLPLGVNGKTWASPSATEITLVASDISAESGWTPSNDTDLATKKYVDDSIPSVPVTDVKVNGSSVVAEGVASIPAIPDISGCEVTTNKVTALSNASTDTEYPSAKCVYDGLALKQNTLTAGTGISIVGDTISATGGGSLPTGTADGQILVWDNTVQDWIVKPKWQAMFQPVEYIESTGTQYIDTGVTYNASTRLVIKEAMNYNSAVFKVEGCFQQISGTYGAMAYGHITANQGKYSMMCKTKSSSLTDADWVQTSVATDGTVHILDIASGSQKIDNTEIGTTTISGTWQSTNTIYIFARNNYGSGANPLVNEKMYSYRIYDGLTLIRDFVPCYRLYDSAIGLYDTVNNVFYGNNGTGTFSKGADV